MAELNPLGLVSTMLFVSVSILNHSWISAMEDLLESRERLSLSKVSETSDIGLPSSVKRMVELLQPLLKEIVLSTIQMASMLSMPKHILSKMDLLPAMMEVKSMSVTISAITKRKLISLCQLQLRSPSIKSTPQKFNAKPFLKVQMDQLLLLERKFLWKRESSLPQIFW